MDLQHRTHFAFEPAAVLGAMFDPNFYGQLELPDVARPEILDRRDDDGQTMIALRYTYTGSVNALAASIVGANTISWTQTLTVVDGVGSLVIAPELGTVRAQCHASVRFEARDSGCERIIAGTLRVGIPIVGGRVERALKPGILDRLELEAAALSAYLSAN
jgi:hypothetical protein